MTRLAIVRSVPTSMVQPASAAPPGPLALTGLRPRNLTAGGFVAVTVTATLTGFWCATQSSPLLWLAGQLLLAAAFVEWFILLHECGHGTLFGPRWANTITGHAAGVLAGMPFPIWKRIHGRHHKWTGWQDLDPTTAALTPRDRSAWARAVVNVCWKYWIPLFSVLYRLTNFWNLPRIMRLFPSREARVHMLIGAACAALLYAIAVAAIGPLALLRIAGVAVLLALMAQDILILSQHTHIPMGQSHGRHVTPHAAKDQERFTRSLQLPRLLSLSVLHFDAHELHHMYPFVPGYALHRIDYATLNTVCWWRWIAAARAVPGEVLLFQNRDDSGFDL
jgi:omega-6 fatty acid desaturase (delta-12 desaturase)